MESSESERGPVPEAAELTAAARALDRLEALADALDARLADTALAPGGRGA